jgi:GNAT superfamily N-acetyltransferase
MIALNVRGEQAELEDFMVEPEFHGRGIGRALMSALFEECSTRRVRSIGLDADPNAEAIYRKFGFARRGSSPSRSIPGRMLPRMVRALQ